MWGLNDVLTYSIAYGMGEEEGRAKAEREKKASSNWHTGTPTEDGYYLCHVQFYSEYYESDEEGYDLPYWFKDGSWEGNDENVRILAWQKIEPYKEAER